MKILYLHGWYSVPGGVKPSFLETHDHEVIQPALPADDFEEAVRIAQAAFDSQRPDLLVGSSRGGAIAMNLAYGETRMVLLCPAWKNWGNAKMVKPGTLILHAREDDVIPFSDTLELLGNSGLDESSLIVVGNDHRLADPEPLRALLGALEGIRL